MIGTQSGSSNINITTFGLTNEIKIQASCLVDQNNESCNWDDIAINTTMPTSTLQVTIVTPQPVTYGPPDFPLPYSVTIRNIGSVYGAIEARAELASTERGNDAI